MRSLVQQQLAAIMLDMSQQKYSTASENLPDFRVSSMPYCALRSLLFRERSESYQSDFYTGAGTALHNTNQKWLTLGNFRDRIFACWKCAQCNRTTEPSYYPDRCEHCEHTAFLYEEITIKYRGLSGHVDLVYEFAPGKYMVIDWKTTNLILNRQRYNWQSKYPASRSSLIQISSYCALLRKLYKLNIVAFALVYVDRSKPIVRADDFYPLIRPWNKRKQRSMMQHIDHACEQQATLQKLHNIISTRDEYSVRAANYLRDLVRNRPCTDEASYDAWMGFKFGVYDKDPKYGAKKGACLLKDSCLSGSKSCLKHVERLL